MTGLQIKEKLCGPPTINSNTVATICWLEAGFHCGHCLQVEMCVTVREIGTDARDLAIEGVQIGHKAAEKHNSYKITGSSWIARLNYSTTFIVLPDSLQQLPDVHRPNKSRDYSRHLYEQQTLE